MHSNLTRQSPSVVHHLKLITLLREILLTGIPVFITGNTRTGKTTLAKETASHGFSDVTYLGGNPTSITPEIEEQFTNAIGNHKSTSQLLVLDEYQCFKDTNIEITEDFLTQYTGSLIAITQHVSNLPSLELFSEFYIVNLGNFYDFDYTIQHFKKNARSENEKRFLNYEISVPLTTKCAITVSSVVGYLQVHISALNETYYKGQCLAALNKFSPQLYGNDYYVKSIVPNLEKIVATESPNYIEGLIALSKSVIRLQELSITITGEVSSGKSRKILQLDRENVRN
ncbi:hypothetical protein ACMGD3_24090 [Lysinibacillus sphaericus]|uniref:hypothetical protein n=1 Tax=Lysinibacillus sphaericus TaxID=1421 RepID=UPI003F78C08F